MSVPQFYSVSHRESAAMVDSFSPGLDKLSSAKTVPFHLLHQQLISMFARLLDKSLHHLLSCPAGSDPHATARNVYRNIRKHFEAQEWINKDILNEKWNAISVCTIPEATYNELLRVNAECANVGVGHSDQQMATKFSHLLPTHHPTAYIGIFTDLARAGSHATIQMLWHTAQITANALSRNAHHSLASHHLGKQAQTPFPRSPFQRSTRVITPRPFIPATGVEALTLKLSATARTALMSSISTTPTCQVEFPLSCIQ
jgi:hypothetical protein